MAQRNKSSGLITAVTLGAFSCVLFGLSGLQLLAAHTIGVHQPWQFVSVVSNPSQFYWTVASTIILGLALGFLASVALYLRLSRSLSDDVEK